MSGLKWEPNSARVELAHERLNDLHLNLNKMLTNIQDIDVAEAIMNLKSEKTGTGRLWL